MECSLRFCKTSQCLLDPLRDRAEGEFGHVRVERTHNPGYGYAVLGGFVEEIHNSRGHGNLNIRVVHLLLVVSPDTVQDEACKWLVCFYRTPAGSPGALIWKRRNQL